MASSEFGVLGYARNGKALSGMVRNLNVMFSVGRGIKEMHSRHVPDRS